ncbi:hypothetical protein H634G_06525 [Metarhizium anisopliae BRIP 53293]|uniref:Uncharacterized protein n=1 Tax=Metarhizium anisopliae BRIP 53293 TaxID=1291518 RepID=A0A0D9NW93_METAN|nr:hypothetical protein H634G_06525 [Metarhizium anisopliae BRIP 53293]KJK87493.1 hypothetical protein H633G_08643 [Metarhizium anisopliae BRIP 53284]
MADVTNSLSPVAAYRGNLGLLKTDIILGRAPVEKVQVSHNNTRVPFVGAWVSVTRDHVDDSAYETLGAGKTDSTVFDLARMFDLSPGGEHTVQVHDSIPAANSHRNTTGSVPYASNTLRLHVDRSQARHNPTLRPADVGRRDTDLSRRRRRVHPQHHGRHVLDQNRIVLCDPFWYFIHTEQVACHSVDRGAVLVHEATRLRRCGGHWQRLQLLLPRWELGRDQSRPR